MLDLGCGPGSLAIPLAQYVGEVVAVDAEPNMIKELRKAMPSNVRAVLARAEQVDESWGRFELAVAGRSFHWFDESIVLENLARITPMLALCAEHQGSEAQSLALGVASRFIEQVPSRGSSRSYSEILAESAFSDVETIAAEVDRTWTADELIGFAYTTSLASPELFGKRMDEFERQLREEVHGREPIIERVVVGAVVGRQARRRGTSVASS